MAKEKWDTDWLIFSRKTRRGAIVLLVLFFVIAISPRIYKLLFVSNEVTSITYKSLNDDSFKGDQDQISKKDFEKQAEDTPTFPKDKSDPNSFNKSEWIAIGLSEKQAESLLNYKESIKGFKSFKDLENVYVLNDEIIEVLRQNVSFKKKKSNLSENTEDKIVEEESEEESSIAENTAVFEINTATKEDLLSISGIGPFFADKIIEQREATGGFVELEQLLSIYNFDNEKLAEVRPYLTVDKNKVTKLNLNVVTVNQLNKHPEINWDMAKSIVDLRAELGAFNSLDQLLLSVYIDSKKYRQIAPYFKVE